MHNELTPIRRQLDDAITYGDLDSAIKLCCLGLGLARDQELLGEIKYFEAQREIINENFPEAMRFLDLAIHYNPDDGAAYNDRALCMCELGELEHAMDYFDKGIAAEPDFATIYHNKGWLLNKLGMHQEAISYFKKAMALEPDRSVTFENLADAYVLLGNTDEALQAYKKAAALLQGRCQNIKIQIEEQIRKLEQDRCQGDGFQGSGA